MKIKNDRKLCTAMIVTQTTDLLTTAVCLLVVGGFRESGVIGVFGDPLLVVTMLMVLKTLYCIGFLRIEDYIKNLDSKTVNGLWMIAGMVLIFGYGVATINNASYLMAR